MHLNLLLQQVDVAAKIKNAPNNSYQSGVLIGSFVPFIILVVLAYWMYNSAKKRDKNGF